MQYLVRTAYDEGADRVRTTIYLPDDLAEEIRENGDGINVSAVCQQALRTQLGLSSETADLGPTSEDWAGALASPEIYQAAIRTLTAERDKLRTDLEEQRVEYAQEVRSLRAQLSEGLSLELLQLQKSLGRWRERAQAAEAQLRARR